MGVSRLVFTNQYTDMTSCRRSPHPVDYNKLPTTGFSHDVAKSDTHGNSNLKQSHPQSAFITRGEEVDPHGEVNDHEDLEKANTAPAENKKHEVFGKSEGDKKNSLEEERNQDDDFRRGFLNKSRSHKRTNCKSEVNN